MDSFIETLVFDEIDRGFSIFDVEYALDDRIETEIVRSTYEIYSESPETELNVYNIFFIENNFLENEYDVNEIFELIVKNLSSFDIFYINQVKDIKLMSKIREALRLLLSKKKIKLFKGSKYYKITTDGSFYKQFDEMMKNKVYKKEVVDFFLLHHDDRRCFKNVMDVYDLFFKNKRWRELEGFFLNFLNYIESFSSYDMSLLQKAEISSLKFVHIVQYINKFKIKEIELKLKKVITLILKSFINEIDKTYIVTLLDIFQRLKSTFEYFIKNDKEIKYLITKFFTEVNEQYPGNLDKLSFPPNIEKVLSDVLQVGKK